MKLRLPQALLTALLVATVQSYALTLSDATDTQTGMFSAGSTYKENGMNYTVDSGTNIGSLTTISCFTSDNGYGESLKIKFQLNEQALYNAYKDSTAESTVGVKTIVMGVATTSNASSSRGLVVTDNAGGNKFTAQTAGSPAIVGDWTGTATVPSVWNDGNNRRYTAWYSNAGSPATQWYVLEMTYASSDCVTLKNEDETSTLMAMTGLRSSGTDYTSIALSSLYVGNVSYTYHSRIATNATGDWTRTYSTYREIAEATTLGTGSTWNNPTGTLVTGGVLTLDAGGAALMTEGDIVVGGSGQLVMNAAQTLGRPVFLGTTTADSGNALKFAVANAVASDVTLIENSSVSNAVAATITSLDLGKYTLTKTGAGTLTVTNPLTVGTNAAIDLQGGTLNLQAVNASGDQVNTQLASLAMAGGTKLSMSAGQDNGSYLTVGKLQLSGGTVTLEAGRSNSHSSGYIIGSVSSAVDSTTDLVIQAQHASRGKASYVVFKNDGKEGVGLTGTLTLKESNSADHRKLLVVVEDADVLANAVVDFNTVASSLGYAALAIGSSAENAATEVSVKGLTGGSTTGKSKVVSYTGTYLTGVDPNDSNPSPLASAGGHTLVITANGSDNYTFGGDLGDTLNVKMTGTGYQTLKNVGADATVTVGGGHLTVNETVGANTTFSVGNGSLRLKGTTASAITVNGAGRVTLNNGWTIADNTATYTNAFANVTDNSNGTAILDTVLNATGDGASGSFVTVDTTGYNGNALTVASGYVNTAPTTTWGNIANFYMEGGNFVSKSSAVETMGQTITLDRDTTFRTWGTAATWGDGRVHTTLKLNGTLKGSGNIVKTDGGTLVLNATTTAWTGGLVLQEGGTLDVERTMTAASLGITGSGILRIGKENSSVALTITGAFTTGAATQNIELGKGGSLTFSNGVTIGADHTLTFGTIGTTIRTPAPREGDTGTVSVGVLTMNAGSLKLAEGVTVESTGLVATGVAPIANWNNFFSGVSGEGTFKFTTLQRIQPGTGSETWNASMGSNDSAAPKEQNIVFDKGLHVLGNGQNSVDTSQVWSLYGGASVTVNTDKLYIMRTKLLVDGGTMTANSGIAIGHTDNSNPYRAIVELKSGSISSTNIASVNQSVANSFIMSGGELSLSGSSWFELSQVTTGGAPQLQVSLTGGTIKAGANADLVNLNGYDADKTNFTIGGVTIDTGGHTVTLNHDYTQTATMYADGSGKLVLDGAITAERLEILDCSEVHTAGTYTDITNTGSGYISASYLLVRNSGNAAIEIGENASFISSGQTAQIMVLQDSSGTSHAYVSTDSTGGNYYINEGSVITYDAANNWAYSVNTTGLVLNGGTLILNKELREDKNGQQVDIYVARNSELSIDEGVTVARSDMTFEPGTAVTLAGKGMVDIGTYGSLDFSNLVTTATTGADSTERLWQGALLIHGVQNTSQFRFDNIPGLNAMNTTIALMGFTASNDNQTRNYLAEDNGAFGTNRIMLIGKGADAFTITNGYSRTVYNIYGLCGDGDFVKRGGTNDFQIKILADSSDWSGSFIVTSGTGTVRLAGNDDIAMGNTFETQNSGAVRLVAEGSGTKTDSRRER